MIRVDHGCEYHLVGDPSKWPCPEAVEGRRGPGLRRRVLRHGNAGAGILFAGPWIGEFGWELARWQGAVRKLALERSEGRALERSGGPGLYTIVMSDPGHHVLYEDFAHAFWEVPDFFLEAEVTRQCDHVRGKDGMVLKGLRAAIADELQKTGPVKDFLTPTKFRPDEQCVVQLAVGTDQWSSDLLSHNCGYFCILPRLRKWNPQKNWAVAKWALLCPQLTAPGFSAAVVGTPEEVQALSLHGGFDPREALTRSIDLLTHARFAIAPESGGALLSLMCGCPTLVFGHESQRVRITQTENFLGTKVKYLAGRDYNFTIDEVARGAIEFMRTL